MSARPLDRVPDIETNSFDGKGSMRRHRPIQTKLAVCSGVASRLSRGTRHWNAALRIHRVGRGFSPLRGDRERESYRLCWMDCYRGLDVDEIRIAGISCERKVVAVRKQRIEGLQDTVVGIAVAGGGIELNPEPWRPPDVGKCVA